jgi:hypothetical protein
MRWIIMMASVLLASCNREGQPQAPTAAESDRLNEADAMLDELAKEEGAAPEGTAPPSNSD